MSKIKSENSEKKIYKEDEFEHFIDLLGDENIENWTIMAQALKVNPDTITAWRQHPRAKEAISRAIDKSVKAMERVGARDRKMHREKLKMLGIADRQEVDVKASGEVIFRVVRGEVIEGEIL